MTGRPMAGGCGDLRFQAQQPGGEVFFSQSSGRMSNIEGGR